MKDPPLSATGADVLGDDPVFGLAGMPSDDPPAHGLVNGTVDGGKDLLADHMSVIARPAPDHGIEHADQLSDRDLLVVFDDCSNLLQKGLHVLLGRLDEQLAVVLTYILAQKIKPVLDMRNAGLLLREFQPAR